MDASKHSDFIQKMFEYGFMEHQHFGIFIFQYFTKTEIGKEIY